MTATLDRLLTGTTVEHTGRERGTLPLLSARARMSSCVDTWPRTQGGRRAGSEAAAVPDRRPSSTVPPDPPSDQGDHDGQGGHRQAHHRRVLEIGRAHV